MKRREFITLLGAAAVWPFAARAQQSAMPVIGYLTGASMTGEGGFGQGLQETGLIEGRDFQIEHRSDRGPNGQLPAVIAEVVARRVSVILAVSNFFCIGGKSGHKRDTDRLYWGQ